MIFGPKSSFFVSLIILLTCANSNGLDNPLNKEVDVADDTNYLNYASHVFKPGRFEPVKSFQTRSSPEELQINMINNDKNLKDNIIEGDIFVINKTDDTNNNGNRRVKRSNIINEIDPKTGQPTRWPNKMVVYEFDRALPQETIELVYKAIDHWQEHTCIKFVKYNPVTHAAYRCKLLIQPGTICGGFIGYITNRYERVHQTHLYLSKDCSLGSVIHELGHIVGLAHEQSRVDRDYYVKLDPNKISKGLQEQYLIEDRGQPNYYNMPYDLFSIMHYGPGDGVLKALDPKRNFLMGQRIGLSFIDINTVNVAYKCSENCPKSIVCRNGGFLTADCRCYCPDGLTGTICESVIVNQPYKNYEIEFSTLTSEMDCTFQNDFCKWQNDKSRSSVEWTFNRLALNGLTDSQKYFQTLAPNFKTGPQYGDRYGSRYGQYIYINSFTKTMPNANAILTTPKLKVSSPTVGCLKFWYHMYQSFTYTIYPLRIGKLSINLRFADGTVQKVWSRDGHQSQDWKSTSLEINLKPPYTAIFIETNLKDWSYGDICIDDIQLRPGPCMGLLQATQWTEWSECVTAADSCHGIQTREQNCIENMDLRCKEAKQKKECVKPNCRVPQWSEWSDWSECSDGCEPHKYRLRKCQNNDLGNCTGQQAEYQSCEKKQICPNGLRQRDISENLPIIENEAILNENSLNNSNIYSTNEERWSEWSKCSSICGVGQQIRTIICNGINKPNATCDSNRREVRDCMIKLCNNGNWSEWSEWSKCKPSNNICEFDYHQTRSRYCLNETCVGPSTEVQFCKITASVDILNYCNSKVINIDTDCQINKINNKTENCWFNTIALSYKKESINNVKTKEFEKSPNVVPSSLNKNSYKSYLIDFNGLKPRDIIRFNFSSNIENRFESKYCFRLYYSNGFFLNPKNSRFYISYFNPLNNTYIPINLPSGKKTPDGLTLLYANIDRMKIKTNLIKILVEVEILDSSYKYHDSIVDLEDVSLKLNSIFITENECFESKLINETNSNEKPFFKPLLLGPNPYINELFQTINNGYYTATKTCGGEFTVALNQQTQISSPNYPAQYPTSIRCNYLIKSPPGSKLSLKVLDLDLEQSPKDQCIDGIEIRYYHLGQPGPVYCGILSSANQLNIKSYNNFIMVIFRSEWGQTAKRRGFMLNIEAVNY